MQATSILLLSMCIKSSDGFLLVSKQVGQQVDCLLVSKPFPRLLGVQGWVGVPSDQGEEGGRGSTCRCWLAGWGAQPPRDTSVEPPLPTGRGQGRMVLRSAPPALGNFSVTRHFQDNSILLMKKYLNFPLVAKICELCDHLVQTLLILRNDLNPVAITVYISSAVLASFLIQLLCDSFYQVSLPSFSLGI